MKLPTKSELQWEVESKITSLFIEMYKIEKTMDTIGKFQNDLTAKHRQLRLQIQNLRQEEPEYNQEYLDQF
jgi:hypothetical protein